MSASDTPFGKGTLIARSPDKYQQSGSPSNDDPCGICFAEHTEQMVCCDVCEHWFHYGCVGVDDAVEDRPWSCRACTRQAKEANKAQAAAQRAAAADAAVKSAAAAVVAAKHAAAAKAAECEKKRIQNSNLTLSVESATHWSTTGEGQGATRDPNNESALIRGGSQSAINESDNQSIDPSNQHAVPHQPRGAGSGVNASSDANRSRLNCFAPGGFGPSCTNDIAFDDNQSVSSTASRHSRRKRELDKLREQMECRMKLELEFIEKKHNILDKFDTSSDEGPGNDEYFPKVNPIRATDNQPGTSGPHLSWMSHGKTVPQLAFSAARNPVVSPEAPTQPLVTNTSVSVGQPVQRTFNIGNVCPPTTEGEYPRLEERHRVARKTIGEDLPIFSGNVLDWPLFITNYEESTKLCGYSDWENRKRLDKCLAPPARELVKCLLVFPKNVPEIISTLRMKYGKPQAIVNAMLSQVDSLPPVPRDNMERIIDFSISVKNLCAMIRACGQVAHFENPIFLQRLIQKLPTDLKRDWTIHKRTLENPDLINMVRFNEWLSEQAIIASDTASDQVADCGALSLIKPFDYHSRKPVGPSRAVHMHSEAKTNDGASHGNEPTRRCRICDSPEHQIYTCSEFIQLDKRKRWETVNEKQLCPRCLKQHFRSRCRVSRICNIDGCIRKHHRLLHSNGTRQETAAPSVQNNEKSKLTTAKACHTHRHAEDKSPILFKVLPVTLYGAATQINTFAFLDDGSSITLLEDELATKLGLEGPRESLCLKWTSDITREEEGSRRVSLQISGSGGAKYQLHGVRTVQGLDLPVQSVSYDALRRHQHLKDLSIDPYVDGLPRILIGMDQGNLSIPLQVREGTRGELSAIETRLGWTIFGPSNNANHASILHHRVNVCLCQEKDERLHNLVKDFFALESLGIQSPAKTLESKDNERARELMEATTKQVDGRFETGLLWRYNEIQLPSSYAMAYRRLTCLESKMKRDPELGECLQKQICEYLENGYARELSPEEIDKRDGRTWYLPIFAVKNPNKPKKTRIVWDAAAKSNGISLNQMLLKGPDLLVSLPDVLMRFRQKPVAICGDIKHMFHQVKIRKDDQNSQRFLWRSGQADTQPRQYVMTVMTFGASCSPSCAQFVKNRNAQNHRHESVQAADAIVKNTYVDDYLDSVDSEAEATKLATDVKRIHSRAGFNMRNWISNSKTVQRSLEAAEKPREMKELCVSGEPDKILGMWWNTVTDVFCFSLNYIRVDQAILNGSRRPTKREVLRTLMSIYDPLGLLAFFLVYVKVLLQDVWRSGIRWDETISDEPYEKWRRWTKILPKICEVTIPRCYLPYSAVKPSIQLHVFMDASEAAYAAVAYWRFSSEKGVKLALIGAKTKVAPLQPLSIPRLELQAAILGARFGNSILNGHTISPDTVVYWSDSETVLKWLRSDQRKYKQFVALRVGEILERTNTQQWRWVPTKRNVADDATKWAVNPEIFSTSRWFLGPDFLLSQPNEWPIDKTEGKLSPVEELRVHLILADVKSSFSIVPDVARIGHWRVLVRSQAYVLRFIKNLKESRGSIAKADKGVLIRPIPLPDPPTPEELTDAENTIFRQMQSEMYGEELAVLKENGNGKLPKTSPIRKMSPYVDEVGVLRHRGRIDAAFGVVYDVKRPILLPRKHPITRMIVDSYHCRFHHANTETVVNEVRQRFVIPRLRVILKGVRSGCQFCKIRFAVSAPPEMGDLPNARLAAFTRPFTFVGMDYFGPMEVSIGRRVEKRYGVLFTCLTVRAVHVEVADTLETDACIMCLRNFIARRGQPRQINSDNGTNLRGADAELKRALNELDQKSLKIEFEAIEWKFIPPASPHMGGSWERLVQSVKTTLRAVLPTRRPSDSLLRSILIEAESIVNTRPLTHVSTDPDDPEALTPNHFLLGSTNGNKPLGEFSDSDLVLRKKWRICQRVADLFWKRWLVEYLPTLTRRDKWHTKVKNIAVGDIVVIVDESRRNSWQKGLIIDTVKGSGEQVRSVVVKTSTGIYTRPATRVAVLDVASNGKPPTAETYGGECRV